jgi:hypothetical protein
MIRSFLIILLFVPCFGFGQGVGKVWTEFGVKAKISDKFDAGVEITNRYGVYGLETFFPQLSVRYKLAKFIRVSIDYRLIFDKDEFTNYLYSNRLNFNTDLKHSFGRLNLAGRIRYQYSFNSLRNNIYYDAEFDQAIRIKPQISYDIKGSDITPVASTEIFYNPQYMPGGKQFTKLRSFIGLEYELAIGKKKNKQQFDVSLGYILDKELNTAFPETKHILNTSITYLLKN